MPIYTRSLQPGQSIVQQTEHGPVTIYVRGIRNGRVALEVHHPATMSVRQGEKPGLDLSRPLKPR